MKKIKSVREALFNDEDLLMDIRKEDLERMKNDFERSMEQREQLIMRIPSEGIEIYTFTSDEEIDEINRYLEEKYK